VSVRSVDLSLAALPDPRFQALALARFGRIVHGRALALRVGRVEDDLAGLSQRDDLAANPVALLAVQVGLDPAFVALASSSARSNFCFLISASLLARSFAAFGLAGGGGR